MKTTTGFITSRPEQSKIKSSTASEVSGMWTSLLATWDKMNNEHGEKREDEDETK